eukprot:TRINITY_DN16996_c0_g2_i3.p1 TRINITY_DN16996_c0_g2~~TRINITY_DN16996_c0_g2_i3.p1  ORF type:complete len:398 (+),score=57.17 TRINITY_DN16996_c0_g2_i3:78-1196(+)
MAVPDQITGDCRICLSEGWHLPAPRAADAGADPAAGGPQQRTPSVGPPSHEAAADAAAELIAPCQCRGTGKYVHKECLMCWLRREAALFRPVPLRCGACQSAFCIVTQRRGPLTSQALLAVNFRQFTWTHWGITAAIVAAVSITQACGISWASFAAYCLLVTVLFLYGAWAYCNALMQLKPEAPIGHGPAGLLRFSTRAELAYASLWCAMILVFLAVSKAYMAVDMLEQLDPDPDGSFCLSAGHAAAYDQARFEERREFCGSKMTDLVPEDLFLYLWYIVAAGLVFLIAHSLVTRRVVHLQPALQALMTLYLFYLGPLSAPHQLNLEVLLMSAICTLVNAVALCMDLGVHTHEGELILDVLEPPAAQPQEAR